MRQHIQPKMSSALKHGKVERVPADRHIRRVTTARRQAIGACGKAHIENWPLECLSPALASAYIIDWPQRFLRHRRFLPSARCFEDAEQLLVPRAPPDLHIAGAALRSERPKPRQLAAAVGRRLHREITLAKTALNRSGATRSGPYDHPPGRSGDCLSVRPGSKFTSATGVVS